MAQKILQESIAPTKKMHTNEIKKKYNALVTSKTKINILIIYNAQI